MKEFYVFQKDNKDGSIFEHGPFTLAEAKAEVEFYKKVGYPDSYYYQEDLLLGE
jgi:hypothetical protein